MKLGVKAKNVLALMLVADFSGEPENRNRFARVSKTHLASMRSWRAAVRELRDAGLVDTDEPPTYRAGACVTDAGRRFFLTHPWTCRVDGREVDMVKWTREARS